MILPMSERIHQAGRPGECIVCRRDPARMRMRDKLYVAVYNPVYVVLDDFLYEEVNNAVQDEVDP